MSKRLIKRLIIPAALIFAVFFVFVFIVYPVRSQLPDTKTLILPKTANASIILDRQGERLGRAFAVNREIAHDLPDILLQALVATEDKRFYEHKGVDHRSLFRAFIGIVTGKPMGGGSTITQQLAKNSFGRNRDEMFSMARSKYREWILSRKIERTYDKDEILYIYLNTVPFGDNIYGVATAADHYFGVSIDKLDVHQYALLVGILKGNSLYHPRRQSNKALERRNTVLNLMVSNKVLSPDEGENWKSKPLDVLPKSRDFFPANGYAIQNIIGEAKAIVGDSLDLYRDGLTIVSTIDGELHKTYREMHIDHLNALQQNLPIRKASPSLLHRITEEVRKQMPYSTMTEKAFQKRINEKKVRMVVNHLDQEISVTGTPIDSALYSYRLLKAGSIALDAKSGEVLCYLGGHQARTHPYDHVQSKRQVASTFKPIVAMAALQEGVSPCDYFPNYLDDDLIHSEWHPRNADLSDSGYYSLQGALIHSMNLPIVNLSNDVGLNQIIEMAKKLGWSAPLPAHPSIVLGSAENSLWEMAAIYGRMQNEHLPTPYFVKTIIHSNGDTIYHRMHHNSEGDSDTLRNTLLKMLYGVSQRGTTASLPNDWAAKTGTSNSGGDAWVMAFNEHYVFGCWVGGSDAQVVRGGSSVRWALPLALSFAKVSAKNGRIMQPYDCDDFIIELPEEKKGFFDFLKRKDRKKKKTKDKKERKNIFKRLFGKD